MSKFVDFPLITYLLPYRYKTEHKAVTEVFHPTQAKHSQSIANVRRAATFRDSVSVSVRVTYFRTVSSIHLSHLCLVREAEIGHPRTGSGVSGGPVAWFTDARTDGHMVRQSAIYNLLD